MWKEIERKSAARRNAARLMLGGLLREQIPEMHVTYGWGSICICIVVYFLLRVAGPKVQSSRRLLHTSTSKPDAGCGRSTDPDRRRPGVAV